MNRPPFYFDSNIFSSLNYYNPENWDKKIFNFDELKFIKASTKSLMHMPINMGSVMTKTFGAIQGAKAETTEQYLILSKDISSWKSDHYF
jgi:hypothetical protein